MNVNGITNVDWSTMFSTSSQKKAASGNSQDWNSTVEQLTDTVNLSTPDELSYRMTRPGVYVGTDGRTNVTINDALTQRDKELVISATGGLNLTGPNGVHQINHLAMQIAMDRATGNLEGPVTASYLNNVISSQRRDLSLNQQQADVLSSAGDTASANSLRSMGPGISFDALDRAFAFIAQHPES